jgi:tripartite-type tricarboxylate transporter receptor subunit TctC
MLVMASGSITINPNIYKKMPFDTKKDLAPITNVASGPMLVVVPEASPAKNIKDLIAMAKASPGKLNFGSAGIGSQVHLATENFADAAGIDITHVPYKGESLGLTDLIGGQVQLMVGNFAAASALLGPGRLRALAVTGKQRSQLLPDVPTVAESGLPGFENTGWFGLLAPAGTPPEVVAKIQRDTARVMDMTEVKTRLAGMGMTPVASSTADFVKQMDAEIVRWATVVQNRKLQQN